MSKYTTEVRFICENKSGLENSTGCDNVDEVLSHCWDKIFTTKVAIFDENYRATLCQKILKHYYLREICSETFGIWKLWLNTRLEEVLPYYNQLYKSALLEFNPLYDVDLTRVHNRQIDENKTENGELKSTTNNTTNRTGTNTKTTTGNSDNNTTTSGTENSNSTSKDLYSDTPQGTVTNLENENYLTNAREIKNVDNTENSGTTKSGTDYSENESGNTADNNKSEGTRNESNTVTGTVNNIEEYIETVKGKQGGENYSSMLQKFRETFLNIDMMLINEFSDLFFGLW